MDPAHEFVAVNPWVGSFTKSFAPSIHFCTYEVIWMPVQSSLWTDGYYFLVNSYSYEIIPIDS